VLAQSDVRDAMAEQATEVATNTPDEFRTLVRNELVKYGEVVKAVGLKAD
jgi:tripartite-type tricarboxylate transporter receptor subunit TctC